LIQALHQSRLFTLGGIVALFCAEIIGLINRFQINNAIAVMKHRSDPLAINEI
jgi:hypothetical protein